MLPVVNLSLPQPLPADYAERVYAGVLGKVIGVYLGRPVEGWTYKRILDKLGPIDGYVNERLGLPLVVTDDDLSGTFTFFRALADHASRRDLTPAQVGQTWLNFELPGAVQGFCAEAGPGALRLENVAGHSAAATRSLALRYQLAGQPLRTATPTFIPPEALDAPGYGLQASPTLYPGQVVRARLSADAANPQPVVASLFLHHYGSADALIRLDGPAVALAPGVDGKLTWRVPDLGGAPCAAVGLALGADQSAAAGTLYLDYLTWDGPPSVTLGQPEGAGAAWRRTWVNAVDTLEPGWYGPYRLIQNRGEGKVLQGTAEWRDYRASVRVRPHLAEAVDLGVCARGLCRYFGLWLVRGGRVQLVEVHDEARVLAEAPWDWEFEGAYTLSLEAARGRLRAWLDGAPLFDVGARDPERLAGAVALLCREGCVSFGAVRVEPAPAQ